jgi:hypothetical protein
MIPPFSPAGDSFLARDPEPERTAEIVIQRLLDLGFVMKSSRQSHREAKPAAVGGTRPPTGAVIES